jgi:hypothetical protein
MWLIVREGYQLCLSDCHSAVYVVAVTCILSLYLIVRRVPRGDLIVIVVLTCSFVPM